MLRLELWFSRSILWNAMLILFVPCNEIFVCWSLSLDHREHTGLVSRLSLPSTDIQLSQVQVQAIYHLIYAAAALLHINHCSRFTRESIRQKNIFFQVSVCYIFDLWYTFDFTDIDLYYTILHLMSFIDQWHELQLECQM